MRNSERINNKRSNPLRIVIWSIAILALLMPLVAMQFTDEVDWDIVDFAVFGAMLLVVCVCYEISCRLSGNKAYRLAVGIALAGMFLLLWANLAVGIIGNEENPANLIFLVIPLVGITGAFIAGFKSQGMARAMLATAIAQGLTAMIALIAGWGYIFILTAFFMMLWLTSAWLFRKASQLSPSGA